MNELVSSDNQPQVRIRINVSRSVKNVYTFDVTVEGTNMTLEEILETHDRVVAELKKRYPDAEVA
jgi:divalent metal cation (Fe/Co/Zn/Cd) transporter